MRWIWDDVRWIWCWLAMLGGCQFQPGVAANADDAANAGDADIDTPTGEPMIDGVAVTPFCDPTDLNLVVCYPFEGSAEDASANHLAPTTTDVAFVAGKVGMAMQFGPTSAADVPDNLLFDVTALTIEAWIRPTQIPGAGQRAGIVDNDGQYGFFLHDSGELQCTSGGPGRLPWTGPTPPRAYSSAVTHTALHDRCFANSLRRSSEFGSLASSAQWSAGGGS
ncbi:MAG: uncharacterized protein H6Q90_4831 [Deltaproteobacteria bacterium]|nr:uncharacterized protein [Deltaproteobacteria bacterium]